jgi:predicted fused transcriptional regulator/phosphomethylpyrimidine kinase
MSGKEHITAITMSGKPEEPAAAGGKCAPVKRVLPGGKADREKKAAHKAARAQKAVAEPVVEAKEPTPEQLKAVEFAKAVLRDVREHVAKLIATAKAHETELRIAFNIAGPISFERGRKAGEKYSAAKRDREAVEAAAERSIAAAILKVEAAKKAAGM